MNKRTMVVLMGAALLSSHASAKTDSVNEWGKWEQLFTAAGQPTVNLPLNFSFNKGPNPIDSKQFVTEIQEGERYYGIITSFDSRNNYYYYGENNQRITKFQYSADENSASFSITGDEGAKLSTSNLPNNYFHSYSGYSYAHYHNQIQQLNQEGEYEYFSTYTSTDYINSFGAQIWERKSDGETGFYDVGEYANLIGGKTTDLNQLQKLAGISSATYSGHMYWGGQVSLNVNFKNASWNGTFDTDGYFYNQHNNAGTLTVQNGTINGANLNASLANISSDTATLSKGSIEGSFFGDSAQQLAGIVDVTSQENGRYVTLFNAHDGKKGPRPN